MVFYARVKTVNYVKKTGTKNVWIEKRADVQDIDQTHYNNIVEASPFFRRLGGTETVKRAYTRAGYKVVKIISISPDRTMKTVRTFSFWDGD